MGVRTTPVQTVEGTDRHWTRPPSGARTGLNNILDKRNSWFGLKSNIKRQKIRTLYSQKNIILTFLAKSVKSVLYVLNVYCKNLYFEQN